MLGRQQNKGHSPMLCFGGRFVLGVRLLLFVLLSSQRVQAVPTPATPPPLPTEPTEDAVCSYNNNTMFEGILVQRLLDIQSIGDCCAHCYNDMRCVSYHWRLRDLICYMKWGNVSETFNNDALGGRVEGREGHGPPLPPPRPPSYDSSTSEDDDEECGIIHQRAYVERNSSKYFIEALDKFDCCDKCADDELCEHFTYYHDYSECYLISGHVGKPLDIVSQPVVSGKAREDGENVFVDQYPNDILVSNITWTTMYILLGVLVGSSLFALFLYCILRCIHKEADNLSALLTIFGIADLVTNALLLSALRTHVLFWYGVIFITVPLAWNFLSVVYCVHREVYRIQVKSWMKQHHFIAFCCLLSSVTGIGSMNILNSQLFGIEAFTAEFEDRSSKLLVMFSFIETVLKFPMFLLHVLLMTGNSLDMLTPYIQISIPISLITLVLGLTNPCVSTHTQCCQRGGPNTVLEMGHQYESAYRSRGPDVGGYDSSHSSEY